MAASCSSVSPYQFQPIRDSDSESDGDSEGYETDEEYEDICHILRKDVASSEWCKCTHCQMQKLSIECVCCREIDESRLLADKVNVGCIVDHDGFESVCLNTEVLWTALVSLADREGAVIPPRDNVPNRTWRYAAYRQFTWWVHSRLGRHVRRVIPSCAVSRIRAQFEDENLEYTTFEGEDEIVSEIVKSMEWVTKRDAL